MENPEREDGRIYYQEKNSERERDFFLGEDVK
jgi:hypothetical protein